MLECAMAQMGYDGPGALAEGHSWTVIRVAGDLRIRARIREKGTGKLRMTLDISDGPNPVRAAAFELTTNDAIGLVAHVAPIVGWEDA